jgi:16S rRNA (cytosine967-C5)-methyltransferase
MSDARRIAALVLRRVAEDEAYAAAALSAELDRSPLSDPRDRALATELVYGVLRTEPYLLERLERHGKIRRADRELVGQLLVAAYQLAFLDRVPARAAVHEAVSEIRRLRGARVAGFANAVLRKVAEGPHLSYVEAVRRSAPQWLLRAMETAVGSEEADALLGAREQRAALGLRASAARALPDWFGDPRRVEPCPLAPRAYRYVGGGDPRRLPGHAEGAFVVQEEGAQLVAWALGARPGERVLDACAGRGQKASLLAERVGPGGELWAADLHDDKLAQLRREFARLKLPEPRTVARDWAAQGGPLATDLTFDRVLVDVPCTGDGTLRRRPEILRRLQPDDPGRLTPLQVGILRGAAQQARPGARVIYATCSVLREACEAVLAEVGDLLEPCAFDAPEVGSVFGHTETTLRLLPGRHGTDGYFVASLRRR